MYLKFTLFSCKPSAQPFQIQIVRVKNIEDCGNLPLYTGQFTLDRNWYIIRTDIINGETEFEEVSREKFMGRFVA